MAPLRLADVGWPGTFMAFGFVASQIVGLGLLLEWIVVWKALRLAPGRAAILSAAVEALVLARWFGVASSNRAFAWLTGANVLSCVIVTMVFLIGR